MGALCKMAAVDDWLALAMHGHVLSSLAHVSLDKVNQNRRALSQSKPTHNLGCRMLGPGAKSLVTSTQSETPSCRHHA